ncbi:MAG TPA: SRPBCC family protein [Acidimicrobiales bacterium]|jgi:uncharacterized membrane protein|nr:SRPBCC family protein [Acidimicrobiales bacterium]
MSDETTQQMVIRASQQRVWDVLTDFDDYPSWAHDLKSVSVVAHDEEGRARDVAFRAAAMGRSTSYVLRYDYGQAPRVLAWQLIEGDITRKLDGSYELRSLDEGDDTEVTYHLEVDLRVPLPGFVKRRAAARIVHTALDRLRSHLES